MNGWSHMNAADTLEEPRQAVLDILVADDDEGICAAILGLLSDAGHRVTVVTDGAQAMSVVAEHVFDAAIVDIRLPKVDGLSVFRSLQERSPGTAVILMTGYATVQDAVASVRQGAFDYLAKPFDDEALNLRIERIAKRLVLTRDLEEAREKMLSQDLGSALVGNSPPMVQLASRIDLVANSSAPVVITGESGTGKELVARAIHRQGPRRDKPFVAVNCAAFPETLLEAELFGHERGAFTGAMKKREGRFKAAEGGTLLLDEIGEIPLSAQVKLLRVLQEGVVEPLGSDRAVPIDVRIVAATHRNLKELIAAGRFREDLFFRLNVLELSIPPLRERKGDLVPLLAYFLERLTPKGHVYPGVSPRAWAALTEYSYPGNVREFAHAIERSIVLSHGGEIDLEHLPPEISGAFVNSVQSNTQCRPLNVAMDEFEREYLVRVLRMTSTRTAAAEMLGISRKGLWEKLRKHGVSDAELLRTPTSGTHKAVRER